LTQRYAELCDAAAELAQVGGRMAAERLGQARASRKADRSWVTDVDLAVQAAIVEGVRARFPDHAVLAEEDADGAAGAPPPERVEYCWVIDPIDGTRNYVRAVPVFSTAVAVLRNGRPIAAATCDPLTGRMYTATRGAGARLDGQPMTVADRPQHADTMIGVPSERRVPIPEPVRRWGETMVLRCTGSTALHLGLVAAGSLDAAYAMDTRIWDIAGGVLMIQEAGGRVTDLTGRPIFPIDLSANPRRRLPFLAAGPELHGRLLAPFLPAGRQ